MKSNNTRYKNKYKHLTLPNKTKRRTMIMMLITVTAFCLALLTIYGFPNRFVYTQRNTPLPLSSSFESLLLQQSPVITLIVIHISVPKLFSTKECNLCNLDFLKVISNNFRPHFESKLQVYTFFSVANPLILCAPPQIFIVAERTRSDLAISPIHSGVTMSNTQQADR